jgi:uncharacterized lipoprotein YajG
MKNKLTTYLLLLLVTSVFLSSCQDETYTVYTANSPVYMSYDDLRKSVKNY